MKNKLRSIVGLLLVLAMVFSLAACGNKQEEQEETPEFVYVADYQTIKNDSASSISPRIFTDDGFYTMCYEKIGENRPEGAVPTYEGEFDVYGYLLYFVSDDGSIRKLDGYESMPAPVDEEDRLNYDSGSNITCLLGGENGTLVVVEDVYENWFDGPESELDGSHPWDFYKNNESFYIRTLDSEGKELSCVPINYTPEEGSYISFYNAVLDPDGNILAASDNKILAVGLDGEIAYEIETENWFDSIYTLKDGRVAVSYWGDTGMVLTEIDTENKKLGDEIPLPNDAYNLIPGDDTYDVYYTSGMYLYGYRFGDEEPVKVINWVDCDVNGEMLSGVRISANGTITGILNTWEDETITTEKVTLTKVPADQVPQKATLTLSVLNSGDMLDRVIEFNRHSDTVRIKIKDYSEYNTEDDYQAGLTKLTTEIMAGNVPDLMIVDELPYTQMAAKGLLTDLYPFLDADKELSRDSIMENVLKASEVNGGLYKICSNFSVLSMIGAPSVVGDTPGWTYSDLYAALETMPEGCEILDQYTTRADMLQMLLYVDMENYVDWTTGQCNFESQDFIDLLTFASRFPETVDDSMEYESPATRVAEGRQMLMTASIYDFEDSMYNAFTFGGDCTYIGFPTNHGVGNVLYLENGMAMSAACEHKDEAWEFLRYFLSEKYQNQIWGLPATKAAFDKKLEKAMTPEYVTDENGNVMLDENEEPIMQMRNRFYKDDGSYEDFYCLTAEQGEKLKQAVLAADRAVSFNNGVYDIVLEQAQAFFAGQKSAEEVCRLIQSKASIYVNEQR